MPKRRRCSGQPQLADQQEEWPVDRILHRGANPHTLHVRWATGEETVEPETGLQDTAALEAFLAAERVTERLLRRRTEEEDAAQLQDWIRLQRNTNTSRTYASAMRQFVAWAEGLGSERLITPINTERPSQANVAAYMRHMVIGLGRPMTTVGIHLSAIADHVRFVVGQNGYDNPTHGPLIRAMRAVLVDHAPRPGGQQKRALDWERLQRLMAAMDRVIDPRTLPLVQDSVRWITRRDKAVILMGFFFLLRRSEVVRMRRGDVAVMRMDVAGVQTQVLQVYVNERCKNDRERRGHVRVAAGRPGKDVCVPRTIARYVLECEQGEPRMINSDEDPLFPRLEGGEMAGDTPNGRFKHWLKVAGISEPEKYGFHSLRAGAATDAYRNGATEEWIKQHGNWKSDAVKIYIRQGIEERLATTAVLGQGSSRAAAAASGRSL